MSVAVAVRIDSEDAPRLIRSAAQYAAAGRHDLWYLISIVPFLPHGVRSATEGEIVARNLDLLAARNGRPIIHEGTDVARCIIDVAHFFGVRTLLVGPGRPHLVRKTVPERLLHTEHRFDIVVVAPGD